MARGVTAFLATRLAVCVLFATGCGVGTIGDGEPGGGDDGAGGGGVDAPPAPRTVDVEGPDILPHVQRFANAACTTTDACTMSTYVGHSPVAARALDILVSDVYGKVPTDDNELGDAVAAYALAHKPENGITYVIWRQRIDTGSGWRPMEDRGSITQNHFDHVHVTFDETAP